MQHGLVFAMHEGCKDGSSGFSGKACSLQLCFMLAVDGTAALNARGRTELQFELGCWCTWCSLHTHTHTPVPALEASDCIFAVARAATVVAVLLSSLLLLLLLAGFATP